MNQFEAIIPVYKKSGSLLEVAEFHHWVNVIFHDHEAMHYDLLHADMRESLQEQFDLLSNDVLEENPNTVVNSLLDFGCGTALATQMFLQTKLAENCTSITLFDTSAQMLLKAKEKSKNWKQEVTTIHKELPDEHERFDAILLSSVLHHIPNIEAFLHKMDNLLRPGGIFIHLQDPNKDSDNDPERRKRELLFNSRAKAQPAESKSFTQRIPKQWRNLLNRILGRKTYIDKINDELLRKKVIKNRLTANELWQVTDIQITKNGTGGISIESLKSTLLNFRLLSHRTYGFFGVLKNDLPPDLAVQEQQFSTQRLLNGRNVAAVWQKLR